MARGCRDCSRCTETCIVALIKLPFRFVLGIPRMFTGAFQKKCPQCGHRLSQHTLVGGRFQD